MSKNREKILVLGHVWPQPNATAAGEHMIHLLECFSQMNYDIHFASTATKPLHFIWNTNFEVSSHQIQLNDDVFDTLLVLLKPSIVLFDRFMTEEQFSWRVEKVCPTTLRVLDTEDLHFLRKQREVAYKDQSKIDLSDTAKRELASIYRSDLSLIISEIELNLLTDKYNVPTEILHYFPLISESKIDIIADFDKRQHLFFVGNFLHEPNWQCILYLKKYIWPKLKERLPAVELHIYGSHAQQKHLQLSNRKERFLVKGYIENIENIYKNYKLLIAPIPFGAGQKGKLLKALEYNLPFVTSEYGAEGMFLEKKLSEVIVHEDDKFIATVCNLYNDKEEWNNIQSKMPSILQEHFNKNIHFEAIKDKYSFLLDNLENHRNKNITGQLLWHHSLRATEYMSRWIIEKNKNN